MKRRNFLGVVATATVLPASLTRTVIEAAQAPYYTAWDDYRGPFASDPINDMYQAVKWMQRESYQPPSILMSPKVFREYERLLSFESGDPAPGIPITIIGTRSP